MRPRLQNGSSAPGTLIQEGFILNPSSKIFTDSIRPSARIASLSTCLRHPSVNLRAAYLWTVFYWGTTVQPAPKKRYPKTEKCQIKNDRKGKNKKKERTHPAKSSPGWDPKRSAVTFRARAYFKRSLLFQAPLLRCQAEASPAQMGPRGEIGFPYV